MEKVEVKERFTTYDDCFLDNETRLLWSRNAISAKFYEATRHAGFIDVKDRAWYIPTIEELVTLMDIPTNYEIYQMIKDKEIWAHSPYYPDRRMGWTVNTKRRNIYVTDKQSDAHIIYVCRDLQ